MIRPRLPHAWEVTVFGVHPFEPIGVPAPVEAEADGEEMFRPSLEEWASVTPRPEPVIAVPYRFMREDEQAEAGVLDALAERIAVSGLSPWEAASVLFGGGAAGVDAPGEAPAMPEAADMGVWHHE